MPPVRYLNRVAIDEGAGIDATIHPGAFGHELHDGLGVIDFGSATECFFPEWHDVFPSFFSELLIILIIPLLVPEGRYRYLWRGFYLQLVLVAGFRGKGRVVRICYCIVAVPLAVFEVQGVIVEVTSNEVRLTVIV